MTTKEKRERAAARAWARDNGLVPPKKRPINKKKLIADAKAALDQLNDYGSVLYLLWGISEMLEHHHYSGGKVVISDQAVGVAKAILLAARRKEMAEKRRESGEDKPLTVGDMYAAMKDIYEL